MFNKHLQKPQWTQVPSPIECLLIYECLSFKGLSQSCCNEKFTQHTAQHSTCIEGRDNTERDSFEILAMDSGLN